jgi:hypothetical protein
MKSRFVFTMYHNTQSDFFLSLFSLPWRWNMYKSLLRSLLTINKSTTFKHFSIQHQHFWKTPPCRLITVTGLKMAGATLIPRIQNFLFLREMSMGIPTGGAAKPDI